MPNGICCLSIVPVRQEPSGKSALVNQLLFGDKVSILEEKGNWLKISSTHDNYEGWCESSQIEPAETLTNGIVMLINDITATFGSEMSKFHLVYGSSVQVTNNKSLLIDNVNYQLLEGELTFPMGFSGYNVISTASKLYGVPYLWGGRSPFGIDCSGLIQIAFKMCGIKVPRDAWQQAEHFKNFIDLIDEALPGDVAFFDNEDGQIVHTGILTGDGRIIHASGKVKIDLIDHIGIFDKKKGSYSHKLRWIKRYNE